MAKAIRNAILQGIKGNMGELVFRQMSDGSTRISSKPDFSRREFSQGQKSHQSRFKEAAAYARYAAQTQPVYAELAKGTVRTPYNWALADWFHPPVIHSLEREGDVIRVHATDNVQVAKVAVSVLDEEGNVIEKVEGIKREGDWWEAACVSEGKVLAEAWDLAGNVTRKDY